MKSISTPLTARVIRATVLACVIAVTGTACAQIAGKPEASAAATGPLSCAVSSALTMPPGVNIERLQLLDKGLHFKVYTTLLAHDEQTPTGSGLPADMEKQVALNRSSLERSLADTIMRTRRLKVYHMKASTVADQSEVEVTAKVVDASQVLRPYLEGGRRVSESWVKLSVQVKNMYTGENLLPSDASVDGWTGRSNGRLVLTSADDVNSPEVQKKLATDYKTALYRALDLAGERVEYLLRPMAKVVSTEDCQLDLFGGSRMGLQENDELVVFRSQKRQLGESTVLANTRAVALVRCSGVGTDGSQCTVLQTAPGYRPQEGDYAVITNESLQRTRMQ